MEVEPSKSSEMEAVTISTVPQGHDKAEETQKLDSSSIDGNKKPLVESNAKLEETKEVYEVIQETKGAVNEKRNNKGSDFLIANSGSIAKGVEEASVTNESEQMHGETQGAVAEKRYYQPLSSMEKQPKQVLNKGVKTQVFQIKNYLLSQAENKCPCTKRLGTTFRHLSIEWPLETPEIPIMTDQ